MNSFRKPLSNSRPIVGLGLSLALALVVVPVAMVGCGGSSGSSAVASKSKGGATLKITWPTSTAKLIPAASSSIVVSFLSGSTVVATKTVDKPTSGSTTTVSFTGLPAGSLTLTATAYPNSGGTGTAQATASQTVAITGGSTASLAITMASTIASLTMSPTSASVAAGSTTTVTATPVDSTGATVLVGTSTLTYASSNTAVATVNATTGVVTGVATGTATITATESESGKTATSAITVSASSGSTVVDLANAYIATLTTAEQTATVVAADQTHAAKWINLPAPPSSDGTQTQRNGISYSYLTTTQQTAWNNLVNAVLASGTALTQFNLIRGSDNVLRNTYGATGYSGDYQYIGIVGTPSTTGGWMIQIGGHHNAHNYYYVGNSLQTTTPYFLGTEPTSYTSGGTTVYPMGTQKNAATAFLSSLSTSQLSAMKLSSSFSDVYLGPGKDVRSNFPTGTSGRGALVSALNLSSTQQTYLKNVIAAWVLGRTTDAYSYQSLYESELSNTYVAYSGNSSAPGTVFTTQGDYLRIDGPHVWIEFVCQNGVVVSGQIHYHSIWRDRVTDYNAAYGF